MSNMIYHEQQVKELCAIHALNNIFQKKMYTKHELDEICETLSPSKWFNPHRSFLGTGNFDINVILSALQNKGYSGVWFDKRKKVNILNIKNIIGYILNAPSSYAFGYIRFPLSRRHWFAVTDIGDHYYNLDSKLPKPMCIGDSHNLLEYLQFELSNYERELFIVVDKDVEAAGSWISENNQD